jgi:hypothetical protein
MTEDSVDYRQRPCTGCPWRTDADLPSFGIADMRKLLTADGRPGAEAPATAPVMSCHQDQPGSPHAMRLCAGWLAVVGPHHIPIRMAQIAGHAPGRGNMSRPGLAAVARLAGRDARQLARGAVLALGQQDPTSKPGGAPARQPLASATPHRGTPRP